MRYGIYYTPLRNSSLARAAAEWLGRDCYTNEKTTPPPLADLSPEEIFSVTSSPRRYGFHGTLKAPFSPRQGTAMNDLVSELHAFAGSKSSFVIPRLEITRIGSFFALTPEEPSDELKQLATTIVTHFDPFRAPLTDADIERRNPASLNARQLSYLQQWGYPYIMDEFRFHLTLTNAVDVDDQARVQRALQEMFDPVLGEPVTIDSIALFLEPKPQAPFSVHSVFQMDAISESEIA